MQSYSPTPITLTGEWWWGSSAAPHNSSGGRACRPRRSLIFSFFTQDLMGSSLLWKRSNPTSAARRSVLTGRRQPVLFFSLYSSGHRSIIAHGALIEVTEAHWQQNSAKNAFNFFQKLKQKWGSGDDLGWLDYYSPKTWSSQKKNTIYFFDSTVALPSPWFLCCRLK